MNIDLRRCRENAGMSQVKVASILGISEAEVSLYEQQPDKVPMGLLVKWLQQICGVDIITAMSAAAPPLKGIDPGTPYAELYRRLNLLNQYIDAAPSVDTLHLPTQLSTPNKLKQQLKLYAQKPNVVLIGGFDAGKSHMANALLGSKNLPVGYQPATRVITFIRHVEDRPEWFKEEDVLIVNEEFWLKDEKGKQIIDLLLLDDQERCEQYCLQAGSFDILQKYGVHGSNEDIAAHAAVVYMDSPLLRGCNLIDLPGYSDKPDEDSKDVEKANSAAQLADVLLYASPAKGHINGQDMSRLSILLRLLPAPENECSNFPTLGNLFIVATHADPTILDHQLKEIPDKASTRLYNQLNETRLKSRSKQTNRAITEEDLRKRFFTFWSERPDRCQRLVDDLTKILGEFLPQAYMCRVEREIKAIKEDNNKKYASSIEDYEKTIAQIDKHRVLFQAVEENEPARQQETQQKRNKVSKRIDDLKQDTIISFQEYAEKLINVDSVEQTIAKKYNDRKEAKEYLAGYFVEKLQNEAENLIRVNSEELKTEIDTFLEGYTEVVLKLPTQDKTVVPIPFDAQGSFIGGLAGLTSIGALSAWAAALGNLGGYILVAKLVSLLSALGISISGGTAAVISFVAAIGGPIVLGIGLAAALAFAVWGLFGESWQKRLAKQIVKYFEEQRVREKFQEGIDQFWQDTANSFEKGADAVETNWKEYLEHLREITSPETQSRERIEEIIKSLKVLRNFFVEIPWSNTN